LSDDLLCPQTGDLRRRESQAAIDLVVVLADRRPGPARRTAPGVSEKRGTTSCIRTDPNSLSGTATIARRALNCGSSKTSAMS
jgi:hypothetical protein